MEKRREETPGVGAGGRLRKIYTQAVADEYGSHDDGDEADSDDDDDNGEDDDPSDSSASAASAACSTASWSHNSSWTWTGTLTSTQTAATSGADNAALSQTTNKLSSGSVAGVVFGVGGFITTVCRFMVI